MSFSHRYVQKSTANQELSDFLQACTEELESFFEIKLQKNVSIYYFQDKESFDAANGNVSVPPQVTGNVMAGAIFTLSKKAYNAHKKNGSNNWFKSLKQGLTLIYYFEFAESVVIYPRWLEQGLACLLADQQQGEFSLNKILNIFSDKNHNPSEAGYHLTSFLLNNFGKLKLLQLIKLSNPKNRHCFNSYFQKIYGVPYTENGIKELILSF